MTEIEPFEPLRGVTPANRFVAFVDILGFARRVIEDFDSVLSIYQELIERQPSLIERNKAVSVSILSDAFVITSDTFESLVPVVQAIHMISLRRNCLVRGGIGFGKHVEAAPAGHFLVVSQALVYAVHVEKTISHPCVAIHESVLIPDVYLDPSLSPIERGVLYYDGLTMICPFNHFWGTSAMTRVAMLWDENPQHAAKYKWFLSLYEAFQSGDRLTKKAS